MKPFQKILQDNKEWAASMVLKDPDFFTRLVSIQKPEVLWIGCSDSRVPADMITGTKPGEMFVHRNVANLVVEADLNLLTVLQFAVEILDIKHIIVCGHYGCGGVTAAMSNKSFGLVDKWLSNIKSVYTHHQKQFEKLITEDEKLKLLTELNVKEQVYNLAKTTIIQTSWKNKKTPDLHGWVYDLHDGIINPVLEMDANSI